MKEVDVRDPETYAIIGCGMEVHGELGPGLLEGVYQEALCIEFDERSIPFQWEVELPLTYKGRALLKAYRADFVVYDKIIVETKALERLSGTEEAQIVNYLKATGLERGLLLNFGAPRLEYKRFINK